MITILKLWRKILDFTLITIKYIFNAFIPQERRRIHERNSYLCTAFMTPVLRLQSVLPHHLMVSLSFSYVLSCTHVYTCLHVNIAVKG